MTADRATDFAFTKLVVDDLEGMAGFYCTVFDLHQATRVRVENGVGGETIEEIPLVASPEEEWGSLVVLKFVDRSVPKDDETILGFTTNDLPALLDRLRGAGGRIISEMKEMPEHGIRVAFARDPEDHLIEIVEMLG